jgi:uncharacterized coiled-coil protein SlyX
MGDPLNIEVISRLERLESRMRVVESRPSPESLALVPTTPAPPAEVEALLRDQTKELDALRIKIALTEERILQLAESGKQLAVRPAALPAKIEEDLEARLDSRVEQMRTGIENDLAKLNRRTITTIERGVDERIAERILPAEKAIRAQAKAIEELRDRVNQFESHLKRLVSTVERLVDRPLQAPAAAQAAPEPPAFRTYLDHAVRNDPMPPPPDVDPLFRPRIIKDDEIDPKATPRRPLTPLT